MSIMGTPAAMAFASGRSPAKVGGVSDRRALFLASLSDQLASRGISLLAAELGREQERAVWLLTLMLPNNHVLAVRAPVDQDDDPLALPVSRDIADRVIRHAL